MQLKAIRRSKELLTKIKKRNFTENCQYLLSIFEDLLFDKRFHVNTSAIIPLKQLKLESDNLDNCHRYEATKVRYFNQLMKHLTFPEHSVFVDIGCGMGRVLLLASQFGFKRIVGIEFSTELCTIAQKNWHIYQNKRRINSTINIFNINALEYKFVDDENVFFLFNPFKEIILRNFITKLKTSLDKQPRKIWILYQQPDYADVYDNCNFLKKNSEFAYAGAVNYIYTNEN